MSDDMTGSGILTGVLIAVVIGLIVYSVDRAWRKPCPHDRIHMHSLEKFANVTYAHGNCTVCGKTLKFNLGFTTSSDKTISEVASLVLLAQGYHPTGNRDYERKRA